MTTLLGALIAAGFVIVVAGIALLITVEGGRSDDELN